MSSFRGEVHSELIGIEENVHIVPSKRVTTELPFLDHDVRDSTTFDYFSSNHRSPKFKRSFLDDIGSIIKGVEVGLGQAIVSKHLIKNNKKGLGLMRYDDPAEIFKHNTKPMQEYRVYGSKVKPEPKNVQINTFLEEYTTTHGCIPKVNIAGHGWASINKVKGFPDGHGLPSYSIEQIKELGKLTATTETKKTKGFFRIFLQYYSKSERNDIRA